MTRNYEHTDVEHIAYAKNDNHPRVRFHTIHFHPNIAHERGVVKGSRAMLVGHGPTEKCVPMDDDHIAHVHAIVARAKEQRAARLDGREIAAEPPPVKVVVVQALAWRAVIDGTPCPVHLTQDHFDQIDAVIGAAHARHLAHADHSGAGAGR